MTERDVLRRAKEVLLERGWTTGSGGMDVSGTPLCLMGALGAAADVPRCQGLAPVEYEYTAIDRLPVASRLMRMVDAAGLDAWNDRQARTLDDVIALLDRAIASLPSGEVVETQEGALV